MKKGLKKIVLILFASITIVFIGFFLFYVYGLPYAIRSELKQIKCNGTILGMTKSSPCFMTVEVKQQNETIKFDVNYCAPKDDFFRFATIGDSIEKQAGTLSLIVTKKDNQVKKIFDYPYAIQ